MKNLVILMVFEALKFGEIDIYPEYTGTAYLVLLQKSSKQVPDFKDPATIYNDVKKNLSKLHNIAGIDSYAV